MEKKRYLVYYFSQDTINQIMECEGIDDIFDSRFLSTVTQYGELVFQSNDEDEAVASTSDYIKRSCDECSVWDSEEKEWIN